LSEQAQQKIDFAARCLQTLSRSLIAKDSIMALSFEWDATKSKSNLGKHGISFEEASTIFGDRRSSTIPDPVHSEVEVCLAFN
jgi:ribonuclease toxin BrnT of type II toxin-antitoxin system